MTEGYEIYEAYLDGHEREIDEGKEFIMEVRNLADLCRKVVRARVARPPQTLPDGQKLWIRLYNEQASTEPWCIQVLEELDEDEVQPVRGDIARGITPKADNVY